MPFSLIQNSLEGVLFAPLGSWIYTLYKTCAAPQHTNSTPVWKGVFVQGEGWKAAPWSQSRPVPTHTWKWFFSIMTCDCWHESCGQVKPNVQKKIFSGLALRRVKFYLEWDCKSISVWSQIFCRCAVPLEQLSRKLFHYLHYFTKALRRVYKSWAKHCISATEPWQGLGSTAKQFCFQSTFAKAHLFSLAVSIFRCLVIISYDK